MPDAGHMIFDCNPADWKQLQQLVYQAFAEMGCHAEEQKTIALVRGNKEVDVYVEDTVHGIKNVYLVECKYWESGIPQDVIHGFRTVVADSGANKGIIIAKKDFQSGAKEASAKAPVELLTWEQFNKTFFEKWRTAASASIRAKAHRLLEFRNFPYGPICDEPQVELTPQEDTQWREYVIGFTETLILGLRDILDELSSGPVRLLRPGLDVGRGDPLQFWDVKTHREWYDYISAQLNSWVAKLEAWQCAFAERHKRQHEREVCPP